MSFNDRLLRVLSDRKKIAWGESLGFNKSTVTRIFGGEVPGTDILNAIMRKENLSLSWLLSGRGDEFVVARTQIPEEFGDLLEVLLEEGHWTAHICNAPNGATVVLDRPGQYEYKGKAIDYRIVEIINGPVSEELIKELRLEKSIGDDNKCYSSFKLCELDEDTAWSLSNGYLGTFKLFGDSEFRGLLEKSITDKDIASLLKVSTPKSELPVDTNLMRGVIELVDNVLVEEGIHLDTPTKARIITAAYRSAEKKGEVDPITIGAIIEAASD